MIHEILRIGNFVLNALIHIWPLLLVTIPIAVVIKTIGISQKINIILKKNIVLAIVIATLIGAISPFCSCSIIPVISSLLISGVPIAPIMSFWLASPSMDPEIFFLSVASLGWHLAVARFIAALLMSLLGGFITHQLLGKIKHENLLLQTSENENNSLFTVVSQQNITNRIILKNSLSSILFVLKFLVIAYILEALILFYVPETFILKLFSSNPLISILRATAIGVPLYTTNLTALGLISGMLDKGLNEGAALAFLLSGATTTIPAMTAVYKLVHKKVFALYLLLTISFAVLSGVIYNLVF